MPSRCWVVWFVFVMIAPPRGLAEAKGGAWDNRSESRGKARFTFAFMTAVHCILPSIAHITNHKILVSVANTDLNHVKEMIRATHRGLLLPPTSTGVASPMSYPTASSSGLVLDGRLLPSPSPKFYISTPPRRNFSVRWL